MKIIGVTGKKQNGKDEIFKIIQAYYEPQNKIIVRLAFGDAIKEKVSDMLNISVEDIEREKEFYRPILQWVGTDFYRRKNKSYWVEQWQRDVKRYCQHCHVIVAPDVRFLSEAQMIRDMGGEIWNVKRFIESNDKHQSETEVDLIKSNHLIKNTHDLEYLKQQVIKLLI